MDVAAGCHAIPLLDLGGGGVAPRISSLPLAVRIRIGTWRHPSALLDDAHECTCAACEVRFGNCRCLTCRMRAIMEPQTYSNFGADKITPPAPSPRTRAPLAHVYRRCGQGLDCGLGGAGEAQKGVVWPARHPDEPYLHTPLIACVCCCRRFHHTHMLTYTYAYTETLTHKHTSTHAPKHTNAPIHICAPARSHTPQASRTHTHTDTHARTLGMTPAPPHVDTRPVPCPVHLKPQYVPAHLPACPCLGLRALTHTYTHMHTRTHTFTRTYTHIYTHKHT
jgi:hypothetical protein